MSKICFIVGAGENHGLDLLAANGDLVIAADGGLNYLEESGINADLIIGDFDSLAKIPAQGNVITLNGEKDYTDTLAAIHEGLERGYKAFHIYCGTGGRIEHTLANIQAIAYLSQSKSKGYLFDKDCVITAVTNDSIAFDSRCRGFISIFSNSDKSTGVFIKGLKYELENAVMANNFPIGISNEFTGNDSRITVESGTLIIVFPRKHIKDICWERPL